MLEVIFTREEEEEVDDMEVKQRKLDVFQFIIHSKNNAINVISRCIDCQFVRKAAVFTAKAVLFYISL